MVDPTRSAPGGVDTRTRSGRAGLTDSDWMFRVLGTAWDRIEQLAQWGYPFPVGADGRFMRSSLQGPEYMRRMRRKAHRSGVRILDHHPALELTADTDGVVNGAKGIARQDGGRPWRISAGAVVLATGGTAFLSGTFGTNVNTGDGLLMAAEFGADLSGMEFCTAYALAPEWGTHTKGRMLQWGSFYDEHGRRLATRPGLSGRQDAQWALAHGERVFARLDRAPEHIRQTMRDAQPNYFLPLDKAGIDPFVTAYPIRMVYEGSVRGTGGLRLAGADCATTVPGLFAAGDAATRELITGAISGGGSHNGSWAIASGTFAGRGAAEFSRRRVIGPEVARELRGIRPGSGRRADRRRGSARGPGAHSSSAAQLSEIGCQTGGIRRRARRALARDFPGAGTRGPHGTPTSRVRPSRWLPPLDGSRLLRWHAPRAGACTGAKTSPAGIIATTIGLWSAVWTTSGLLLIPFCRS